MGKKTKNDKKRLKLHKSERFRLYTRLNFFDKKVSSIKGNKANDFPNKDNDANHHTNRCNRSNEKEETRGGLQQRPLSGFTVICPTPSRRYGRIRNSK